MKKTKPYAISKNIVYEAFLRVKANRGSAGIDDESIEEFELNLKDNLYKLWNRMSSGSYFPPAVKAVDIPKKAGGTRTLGIRTVADRIAQMTAKLYFEPTVEPFFHKDSYGYRPGKSAIQAIEITRKRCWRYNWVLEFDIKGYAIGAVWSSAPCSTRTRPLMFLASSGGWRRQRAVEYGGQPGPACRSARVRAPPARRRNIR